MPDIRYYTVIRTQQLKLSANSPLEAARAADAVFKGEVSLSDEDAQRGIRVRAPIRDRVRGQGGLLMAAKIVSVSSGLVWPIEVRYLAFFPNASEYLRYSAHWHVIHHTSGMRQNLPLNYGFVVVLEGKFDIKTRDGKVVQRIHVASDQIWRLRETQRPPAPELYAMCVGGREAYERSGGARALARAC